MRNIIGKRYMPLRVLGIETSCDETAAAVVTEEGAILSNIVFSQIKDHARFGGVIPEISARNHLEVLRQTVEKALKQANISFNQLDAIAATCGPGLIGGVLVGAMMGKAIAAFHQKPFLAVNHLEGHVLTARLTHPVEFPYLLLLVSGGHTQLIQVEEVGKYMVLGTTLDDALGECFDKVAKMLGLPYPGGPALEQLAQDGNDERFSFPRPLYHSSSCDFSFSGLKTAVRYTIEKLDDLDISIKADIAASFQTCVIDILRKKIETVIEKKPALKTFIIAGGVGANIPIRQALQNLCRSRGLSFIAPPVSLCTDNGAMIAWAGLENFRKGLVSSLDFVPRPRWPLASL
jgi:N6-L-threonylcarbamoyladenine synthase